jgi:transcriptional regulator with XRE-family HTH domain
MAGRPPKEIDTGTFAGALGANVRAARVRRKMRAADLAAAIGRPVKTLWDWEVGRGTIPAQDLAAIAAALRCSVPSLLPARLP